MSSYEQVSETIYGKTADVVARERAAQYQQSHPFFTVETRRDPFGGYAVFATTELGTSPSQDEMDAMQRKGAYIDE